MTMAGSLDNLEAEATKPAQKRSSNHSTSSRDSGSSSISGAIAEVVAEIVFDITAEVVGSTAEVVAKGGINSQMRYQEHRKTSGRSLFRQEGDPILPSFGYTSHWLNADDDISAQLNRIELGYGMFGLSYSENTLNEDGDKLTLSNTLIHYRMSLGNNLSWDFALGKGKMNGNQTHQGEVFAMPIRLRVHRNVHLEYYPTWSSYNGGQLSEHQFSINWQGAGAYKYFGVTAGYKKWSAGSTTINGFFTGLNLTF
jgi:hypothetical protein